MIFQGDQFDSYGRRKTEPVSKVRVIEEYPIFAGRIPSSESRSFRHVAKAYGNKFGPHEDMILNIPSVMMLSHSIPYIKYGVRFSRQNVFTRDRYTCQYCNKKFDGKSLNYDHVKPRKDGGKTDWENIVASCYPCNLKKGGRTPEEASMKLPKLPVRPMTLPLVNPNWDMNSIVPQWIPYMESVFQYIGNMDSGV